LNFGLGTTSVAKCQAAAGIAALAASSYQKPSQDATSVADRHRQSFADWPGIRDSVKDGRESRYTTIVSYCNDCCRNSVF
jgi:hypothetical protein